MKKIVYTATIVFCSFAMNSLYSQTEYKCFSSEKNSEGEAKAILVKLVINGNKVEANYRKDVAGAGNNSHIIMNKKGSIEGDKIAFQAAEGTNKNDFWYFKNGSLIVGDDVLKSGGCN